MDSSAFLLDLGLRWLEQSFCDQRQINIILHSMLSPPSTLETTKRLRTWDKEAVTERAGVFFLLTFYPGR